MNSLINLLSKIESNNIINHNDNSLGDRSNYVGASDIGACPRATYLSKLSKQEIDAKQARIFKRGHLAESFIRDTFSAAEFQLKEQVKVSNHNNTIRAHIDFVMNIENKTLIVECKSVSSMPSEAYESWVLQVQLQRKLLADSLGLEPAEIAAAIYAIDLTRGEVQWFEVDYDLELTNLALQRANNLVDALVNRKEPKAERQTYCSNCPHKASCPLVNLGNPSEKSKTLAHQVISLNKTQKNQEAQIKQLRDELKSSLEADGVSSLTLDDAVVSITKETIRKSLDTKALKADKPDIFDAYQKETTIAPALKIS